LAYPVINNIGVGTDGGNYFQPINWNMQFFNYFIWRITGPRPRANTNCSMEFTCVMTSSRTCRSNSALHRLCDLQANTTALYDAALSSANTRVAPHPTPATWRPGTFLGHAIYEVRAAQGKYYMRQNEDSIYFRTIGGPPTG
jgi:hypothetical protein